MKKDKNNRRLIVLEKLLAEKEVLEIEFSKLPPLDKGQHSPDRRIQRLEAEINSIRKNMGY